jgi:hypothetical protein
MTPQEILNEFDLLYNNLSSNSAPPLDPYEISVLMTKAQEELILTYYSGYNNRLIGFESTEETAEYLSKMVKEYQPVLPPNELSLGFKRYKVNKPEKLLFILREHATAYKNKKCDNVVCVVNPVTQDNLNRVIQDPYKQPNDRKVLRCNVDNQIQLYSKLALKTYVLTYLEKPNPIILVPLDYNIGNTIDGEDAVTTDFSVPDIFMRKIINRAVELAKVAYIGDLNATLSVNQRTQ